ncbi:hypothetical protein TBLA_0C06230 [Henningerozyma blattae CBS 6284]|uniref:Zn(2)-C6 fungal-type domain-containing protein n=1 Tax=Henningerozyma blattae (strain ATCC 34711 / CBS 6284 / DSM 70876 / NBRC 10599 / NRRL Y-10934 / UCD 77-7) TaxID=1071380 RepID=I2H217_HENB6|nr:hypothetical protein TBLA_0C06230 [Tetrapisispora blattae CBS 6284]CCH60419.1 hypothetical protein TBLA_0C06230 [Tetrapisispora blattae CBS 6284]
MNKTRKRRKIIKACVFCRKRKLKCDLTKPKCKQCSSRNLNCIYTNQYNFDLSDAELFANQPNIQLLNEIAKLKEKHQTQAQEPDKDINLQTINPYWQFKIQVFNNNTRSTFGPTSWRTAVSPPNQSFNSQYPEIWENLQPKLLKLKIQNDISLSNPELRLMQCPLVDSKNKNTSMLNELIHFLPNYYQLKLSIDSFFSKNQLMDFLKILNYKKISNDIHNYFLFDPTSNFKIKNIIIPDNGRNFYSIGIIILILIVEYYPQNQIPDIVERFLCVLTGINNNSSMNNYLEKIQFLLLKYFIDIFTSIDNSWSDNNCGNTEMVSQLIQLSLNLGLDDIDNWYKKKNDELSIDSNGNEIHLEFYKLKQIWLWVNFVDISIAFNIGRITMISNNYFNLANDNTGNSIHSRRTRILIEFLELSKNYINEINYKFTNPNLPNWQSKFIKFIDSNILPIKYYTDEESIYITDQFDTIILLPSLSMLTNMLTIEKYNGKYDKICKIKFHNTMSKFILITLKVCINVIIRSYIGKFEITSEYKSEFDLKDKLILTKTQMENKSLNIINFFISSSFQRIIAESYSLFFLRLASFERNDLLFLNNYIKHKTFNYKIINFNEDLTAVDKEEWTFMDTLKNFQTIIDHLNDSKYLDLQNCIKRSYSLNLSFAMEKIGRKLLDKGLETGVNSNIFIANLNLNLKDNSTNTSLKSQETNDNEHNMKIPNTNNATTTTTTYTSTNATTTNTTTTASSNSSIDINTIPDNSPQLISTDHQKQLQLENTNKFWSDYKEQVKALWDTDFQDLFK